MTIALGLQKPGRKDRQRPPQGSTTCDYADEEEAPTCDVELSAVALVDEGAVLIQQVFRDDPIGLLRRVPG